MKNEQRIEELFRVWQENPGAGGQLVVSYQGERLERCYGYQNIETQTPMTQQSVFHLASMSKQFTALCIYMLFEQGKLDLEDDIRKYLPDLVQVPQTITINHLLHHTSGLPDHYGFLFLSGRSKADTVTMEEIVRLNSRIDKLNFEPGEKYAYSNPNYCFLAVIVERLSGMSLPEFCRRNIFEPLGMTHTFIRHDPEAIIPNRASSYMDDGYHYRNAILNLCMYGSTAVHSIASDIDIYLRQYTNPTLIRPETMRDYMLKPGALNDGTPIIYAGGVFVEELGGHRIIHHGGVNAGFRTMGLCMPDDELYVTLLSNTHNLGIELTARDVARVLLDIPLATDRLADYKADSVDLAELDGFYYNENSFEGYPITVRDGVIYTGNVPLRPLGGNLFKQGRQDITFAFGEQSAVCHYGGVSPLVRHTEVLDAQQAQEYVGEYFCRTYESYWKVLWEEDQLWLYHLRHGRLPLYMVGQDAFFYDTVRYDFCRNEEGRVIGVNRSTTRQKYMMLDKIGASV